jgi:hypothetical protein
MEQDAMEGRGRIASGTAIGNFQSSCREDKFSHYFNFLDITLIENPQELE